MPREFHTDVDLKGLLCLGGSAGTAGKVLTSQGPSSPPTWETPAGGSVSGNVQLDSLGIGVAPISGVELALNGSTFAVRSSVTAVSSVYTLDIRAANEFVTDAAIAGNVTINLSNLNVLPSGYTWRGVLRFAYTSGTVSWFTGNSGYTVKWDGGTAVTLNGGQTEAVVIDVVGGSTIIEVVALRGRA